MSKPYVILDEGIVGAQSEGITVIDMDIVDDTVIDLRHLEDAEESLKFMGDNGFDPNGYYMCKLTDYIRWLKEELARN